MLGGEYQQKIEKNERMTVVQMCNLALPGTISMHYGASPSRNLQHAQKAIRHACLEDSLHVKRTSSSNSLSLEFSFGHNISMFKRYGDHT